MPDRASVRAALAKIKRYADYEYFFDHLGSPDWIEPLVAEGLFKEPPEPVQEGNLVSFPGWAESRYLKRMAALAPEKVLPVIRGVPKTENPRVEEDLVDAILAMPPNFAAKLVEKAEEWAGSPYQLLLPGKLGQLIEHLANGGYPQQALRIARVLLSVQGDSHHREDEAEGPFSFPPRPKAHFHEWQYNQILRKYMPALVEAAGIDAVELLANLLNEGVQLSQRKSKDAGDTYDHSYVWRPAIEGHEQNRDGDVRDHLVSALRDAAETVISSDRSKLKPILDLIERRRWKVFQRMALHLLRTFVVDQPELVRRFLLDPELAEDVHVFHEFWLLAREAFPLLSEADQAAFMTQLQRKFEEDLAEAKDIGDEEKSKDGAQFARAWLHRRLTILRDVLPQKWRDEYEHLRNDVGEFPNAEFLTYMSGVWHGPTSPKSSEELASMPVDELVDYLRKWRPTGQPMEDSPEGLARSLEAAVSADPAKYATRGDQFVGLDPTYVRGIISGLRDAIMQKRDFPWQPVVVLSRWVLSQSREIEGRRSEYHDLDPGWVWTRKAIADLFSAGLEPGPSSLPYANRDEVWAVLKPLTDDPDPDPAHEAKFGGSNMDPLTLSINTTRGGAMHAAVRYGLWVRSHFEQADGEKEQLTRGFDAMHELRDVLEDHLRPTVDPSLAIRAVYGQWFPWLHLLDPKWTADHVASIFPDDPEHLLLRVSAWDAYVLFGGVYNNIFDVLRAEYEAAVERLDSGGKDKAKVRDPESRLAEHLMVFYWRSKLELGPSDSLLVRFFSRGSARLRGHALAFVGRSLEQDQTEVPAAILKRLEALWEWRLAGSAQLPAEEQREELDAFGWWFASGKFSDSWSVEQLVRLLRRTGKVEGGHMVVERLSEVARAFPEESIRILRLMIGGDDTGWGHSLWLREAEPVVGIALESENARAREDAISFIHYLGAKGIDRLEHLLPGSARPKAGP